MNPVRAGVLAGLTVAAAVAVEFGPLAVSLPGGLLLAFVLPGLALNEAVFRPGRRDVGLTERAVLVPSLSLVVLVLGGLGLWSVGGHLNRTSWTLVCAVTTLIATGVAYYRTLRAGESDDSPPATTPAPTKLVSQERLIRDVLPLTLAVLLVAGAGVWSYADSVDTYDVAVSSLSAAPPGPVDTAGNRVLQVSASGLKSIDGPWRMVWIGDSGAQLGTRDVAPDGDGAWTGQVTVPGDERIVVNLFRGGDATAFRTLIIASQ
ncbi:hypothetical protein Ait01nite_042830 [Actinoplanes italicus]|uniref:Uncharacterized protein DUF1616 n=1 Tax=Actinoplanes italicus TaxID=113567 RepID=A0A2T0KCF9_9ACTN|nr:DUF1616 domain-containing protein [Actinoplanes italicus]PRX20763.1 uncharacterized protein DUF1616 [Actinoplanes italicus]GIE31238.1 hypothetical protein Ait01nite_042830 [Actinoplanes italicus]